MTLQSTERGSEESDELVFLTILVFSSFEKAWKPICRWLGVSAETIFIVNIHQSKPFCGNCFLHPINFDSHPTKILKSNSTLFHTFAYGFQYPEVIFTHSGFWNPEGYFHISFKLPDGHIRKWVMSSGFLYPEWCIVNGVEDWDPKLIYVCLRILISGRSFMLSK